jgi:hypothetical protein
MKEKLDLEKKLNERDAKLLSMEYQQQMLIQEKEGLQQRVEWYSERLTATTDELKTLRVDTVKKICPKNVIL